MKPTRNRYGITRWIGPRPTDDGDLQKHKRHAVCIDCGKPVCKERPLRCIPCSVIARAGKPKKKVKQKVAECGTDGGYYRHRRVLNEPACDACKAAHAAAVRDKRKAA